MEYSVNPTSQGLSIASPHLAVAADTCIAGPARAVRAFWTDGRPSDRLFGSILSIRTGNWEWELAWISVRFASRSHDGSCGTTIAI